MTNTALRAMAIRWIRGQPKAGRTWTVEDLARDAEIALPLGCAYCGVPFATARDKRRGLTIDVLGENMARGYPANAAFCCGSCNSSKSGLTVAQWIARSPVLRWAVEDRRHQWVAP